MNTSGNSNFESSSETEVLPNSVTHNAKRKIKIKIKNK